jgi:hypothetical protein
MAPECFADDYNKDQNNAAPQPFENNQSENSTALSQQPLQNRKNQLMGSENAPSTLSLSTKPPRGYDPGPNGKNQPFFLKKIKYKNLYDL